MVAIGGDCWTKFCQLGIYFPAKVFNFDDCTLFDDVFFLRNQLDGGIKICLRITLLKTIEQDKKGKNLFHGDGFWRENNTSALKKKINESNEGEISFTEDRSTTIFFC